jgi:DNA-binding NarL/FixJ family response regulator
MINILIADDHQLFVDGLISLLEDEQEIRVVAKAKNGQEVIDRCKEGDIDLVIMDINMPVVDGIQASKELSKHYPDIKIIGLSMYNERNYIADMLKAGASGYILKNTDKENLLEAIHTIQSGANYLGTEVSTTLLNGFMKNQPRINTEKLSDREKEVLECIASGLTTHEVGEKLFISKNTVETHRKNLLYKLKARNTAELITNAYKQRLIQ